MEFESLFIASKGQSIVHNGKELVMADKINLSSNKVRLKITFVSTDSVYSQGIYLRTKGIFEVNGLKELNKMGLWADTAPKEVEINVNSKDRMLYIYNVWEANKGTVDAWHNGAAIHIQETNGIKTYNCNDGYPDDDFNDLIFTVEFL